MCEVEVGDQQWRFMNVDLSKHLMPDLSVAAADTNFHLAASISA